MDSIFLENLLTGFTGFSICCINRFPEENGQNQLPPAKPNITAILTSIGYCL